MGVREYDSLEAVRAAQEAGGFSDFEDRLLLALDWDGPPYEYDDVIIGGRYFAVGTQGRSPVWTVLEAQPTAATQVACPGPFATRSAAIVHAHWLACGPHPDGLSLTARLLLDQLAEAGTDGCKWPCLHETTEVDWFSLMTELRCHGFTVCDDLVDDGIVCHLHSAWAGHTGAWSEDWHILRETRDGDYPLALAEGLSGTKAREFLQTRRQQGRSVRQVTVENTDGLRSAEEFLTALE